MAPPLDNPAGGSGRRITNSSQENTSKNGIFDLADKFGYESPFEDWLEEDIKNSNTNHISASGYWTSDYQGKNKITSARLGETVYFQLSTKNISTNKSIRLGLYDSNSPFKKTDIHYLTYINVLTNGKQKVKLSLDIKWNKYIKEDAGDEIELFWILEYNNLQIEINSILNVYEDKYLTGIIKGDISYSCNCGWIDKSHAFKDTERNRIDIGAKNLWKQIINEMGIKSEWSNGYKVTYTQDAQVGPITVGVTKNYFVKYGLPLKTKERIALSIFQEVSIEFEQRQAWGVVIGRGDSSFEPADLVSNLLGFYRAIRPELTKEFILGKGVVARI